MPVYPRDLSRFLVNLELHFFDTRNRRVDGLVSTRLIGLWFNESGAITPGHRADKPQRQTSGVVVTPGAENPQPWLDVDGRDSIDV